MATVDALAQLDAAVLEAVRSAGALCSATSLAGGAGLEQAVVAEALERLALRGDLVRVLRADDGSPSYRLPRFPLPLPVDHASAVRSIGPRSRSRA
jgi:hypothetical protein